MPTTTLTFAQDINVSVQVGDIIYYAPAATVNQHDELTSGIIELGVVLSISGNTITVDYQAGTALPSISDFIMFAKDRSANMSSLLGYFAEFQIRNNSTEKAEMYSISVDVTESSK
tara:strand:- start:611 stop:958 length:348 start_codon:yes stop_codon:yes gene_type:complete